MPFAPTRNNRVAPRKRTLTSPTPTVKDGMVRRGRPARPSALPFLGGGGVLAARAAGNQRLVDTPAYEQKLVRRPSHPKPPVGTPMSAPSVKTGRVATGNTVKRTGVGKTIAPKLLARPLKTKITKKKSR